MEELELELLAQEEWSSCPVDHLQATVPGTWDLEQGSLDCSTTLQDSSPGSGIGLEALRPTSTNRNPGVEIGIRFVPAGCRSKQLVRPLKNKFWYFILQITFACIACINTVNNRCASKLAFPHIPASLSALLAALEDDWASRQPAGERCSSTCHLQLHLPPPPATSSPHLHLEVMVESLTCHNLLKWQMYINSTPSSTCRLLRHKLSLLKAGDRCHPAVCQVSLACHLSHLLKHHLVSERGFGRWRQDGQTGGRHSEAAAQVRGATCHL